jgi:predicted metal-dependent phosphoesterase TrpH
VIDLHAHTTASDGVLAPAELINLALERGLTVLGITDHDSTDGILPAHEAARGTGLSVVPGVELNTDVPRGEVHVLGYFVQLDLAHFQDRLAELRRGRFERGRRMVERLAEAGAPVSWPRVQQIAGEGAIGRPHVAQALIEAGHVATTQEAFDRYIGQGRPAYVERVRFGPEDAVRAVISAGGAPVLAHPVLNAAVMAGEPEPMRAALEALEPRLDALQAAGLRGLEVYYGGYAPGLVEALEEVADRRGLIRTGGSDFHGGARVKAELGGVALPPAVAEVVVDQLRAAASQRAGLY